MLQKQLNTPPDTYRTHSDTMAMETGTRNKHSFVLRNHVGSGLVATTITEPNGTAVALSPALGYTTYSQDITGNDIVLFAVPGISGTYSGGLTSWQPGWDIEAGYSLTTGAQLWIVNRTQVPDTRLGEWPCFNSGEYIMPNFEMMSISGFRQQHWKTVMGTSLSKQHRRRMGQLPSLSTNGIRHRLCRRLRRLRLRCKCYNRRSFMDLEYRERHIRNTIQCLSSLEHGTSRRRRPTQYLAGMSTVHHCSPEVSYTV